MLVDGVAVNYDPRVTENPVIHSIKSDDEFWIGACPRQHAIEQQATLQAVAVGQTNQSA